jgi:hypothetical protein
MRKGTHTWTVEITHAANSPGDIMVGVCMYGLVLVVYLSGGLLSHAVCVCVCACAVCAFARAGVDVSTSPSWLSDNAWLYHINQRSIYHKGACNHTEHVSYVTEHVSYIM